MLYRVGVPWWGSSLLAATKEDRLPIWKPACGYRYSVLSWRLCLLDEGFAQRDDAAHKGLDLLAH